MIMINEKNLSKKCPPVLRKLLRANDFSYAKVAALVGVHGSYLASLARGEKPMSPRVTQQVKALAAGKKVPPLKPDNRGGDYSSRAAKLPPIGEEFDRGELGIAIVIAEASQIERIHAAGEQIGGVWCFRRRQKSGDWLMILKLEDRKALSTFKTLVQLAADVVTP